MPVSASSANNGGFPAGERERMQEVQRLQADNANLRSRNVELEQELARQRRKCEPGTAAAVAPVGFIIRACAEAWGVNIQDIIGPRKLDECSKPRLAVCWLAHEIIGHSFSHIGQELGGRHHTTVLSAVRKAEELRHTGKDFAAKLDTAEKTMRSALPTVKP